LLYGLEIRASGKPEATRHPSSLPIPFKNVSQPSTGDNRINPPAQLNIPVSIDQL